MNVAYHILAACAAFAAAAMILGDLWGGLEPPLSFSLHPIQTESVAYLAGRRDILLGLFCLLGLCFWLKRRVVACLIFCLLAFSAKQSAVTLPIALWTYEIFARLAQRKIKITFGALLSQAREELFRYRRAAAAIILCVAVLGAFVVRREPAHNITASKSYGWSAPWYGDSAMSNWATMPKVLVRAACLVVWPRKLIADYSYNAVPASRSFFDPDAILPLALLVGLAFLAWQAAKKRPILAFAFAWTALTYLPHLPIIPTYHNRELFAEHWLYLPLFGPALIFGYFFAKGRALLPRFSAAASAAVLAAFMIRGAQRNLDWKDDLTFWARTVQDVPACARARSNLGNAYLNRGLANEALQEYKKAVEIQPSWVGPYFNLGQALLSVGQIDEAIKAFRKSIELSPRNAFGWDGLVTAYMLAGRNEEVRSLSREAERMHITRDALFQDAFCITLIRERDYAAAEKCYLALLRTAPGLVSAHGNLGAVYLTTGKLREAEREIKESLRINPNQPAMRANFGLVYGKMGKLGPAMREILEAERMGYPRANALLLKGIVFRDCRLLPQSLKALLEAHHLRPTVGPSPNSARPTRPWGTGAEPKVSTGSPSFWAHFRATMICWRRH